MPSALDRALAEALAQHGDWSVLLTGWPDILAYNDQRHAVMAVEIKRGKDKLRPDQLEMRRVFTEIIGVPFHVAYDTEIAKVMARTGRVMWPGQNLTRLQTQANDLRDLITEATRRLEKLERQIESTTVVFSDLPDLPEPAVDVSDLLGNGD